MKLLDPQMLRTVSGGGFKKGYAGDTNVTVEGNSKTMDSYNATTAQSMRRYKKGRC